MRVGDKAFVNELLKALDRRAEDREKKRLAKTGIGVVSAGPDADQNYSVYLYGTSSGYPASGGFKSMNGIVPMIGDAVSYVIDGQNRHITGILHGNSTPYSQFSPSEGWVQFTDGAVPSSPPPAGQVYYYWKDGVAYYMDENGTEAPVDAGGGETPDPPPSTPTALTLTPVSYETDVGLEASWTSAATNVQQFTLMYDRAYTGTTSFTASVSGTGGSLAAGDYTVVVSGVANGGESACPVSNQQTVTLAAGERLYVNITAMPVTVDSYNVYASVLGAGEDSPKYALNTSTTGSNVEVTAAGTGAYPQYESDLVTFNNPVTVYTDDTLYSIEGLLGGTYYGAKVKVTDKWNQSSAYSAATLQITGTDSTAPAIPSGVSLQTGYRMLGALWSPNQEYDFDYYDIRYAPEDTVTPGQPDVNEWASLRSRSNWVIIQGLDAGSADGADPAITYFVQVRAVDTSGNASDWSNQVGDYTSATPSLISGTTDVAYNTIVSNHIAAAGIEAEKITSGSLKIGGTADIPDYLLVYNATGDEIGRWDANGILIKDSNEPDKQIRIIDGVMSFTSDGGTTWSTAISSEGIVADSILTGNLPGGHNPVPNASLEIAPFSTINEVSWTSASDWQGHITSTDINWDDSADPAGMLDYTF